MSLDKVQIITKEIEPVAEAPRRTITGKHVLMAVTVTLVIAIAVGGVLGAMAMSHKNIDHMLQNIKEQHIQTKKVDETIKVDVKKRTEEIDSKDKETGNKIKVIHDFKRELSVYKVGDQCLVSPLNRSETPENVQTTPQQKTSGAPEHVALVPTKSRVSPNILGEAARKACKGLDIFWLTDGTQSESETETGSDMSPTDSTRQKRQITNRSAIKRSCRRVRRAYYLAFYYPRCLLYCCSRVQIFYIRRGYRWYRYYRCYSPVRLALPSGSMIGCF